MAGGSNKNCISCEDSFMGINGFYCKKLKMSVEYQANPLCSGDVVSKTEKI